MIKFSQEKVLLLHKLITAETGAVGSQLHNQAKRDGKLACLRESADFSANAPPAEPCTQCRRASGGARKENDVGDSTDELAVLDDTPIGVKGTLCPWCYALRLPTANRRGAICGIRPDKRASRCELP